MIPEALAARSRTADAHERPWRDRPYRRRDRERLGNVAEREKGRDRRRRDRRPGNERLHLRGEREALRTVGDEERLLAEAIAPEDELALLAVPECESERARQTLERRHALVLVEVQDHLAPGRRLEAMAGADQLETEVRGVRRLAVGDEPQRAALVAERL